MLYFAERTAYLEQSGQIYKCCTYAIWTHLGNILGDFSDSAALLADDVLVEPVRGRDVSKHNTVGLQERKRVSKYIFTQFSKVKNKNYY